MKQTPFLIGLTGSIGMGKSTTAAMFSDLGVPVWDADAAVHRLYGLNGAAVTPIGVICPSAILEGTVQREKLKQWIAKDPSALTQIEEIVHPLVAKDRADFISQAKADIVLLDVPLLFETGASAQMDAIVVVSASIEDQRRRVMDRANMTEAQFEAILAKQLPDAEKRKKADYVIETTSLENARKQVNSILNRIKGQNHA